MTRVVNVRRESYDVDIRRPSKWGNPFVVGRDGTRDVCIALFRLHCTGLREFARTKLRGKVLGCVCKPLSCHGDVLAEWADAENVNE